VHYLFGVCLERGIEAIRGLLAIVKAGGAYLLLARRLLARRLLARRLLAPDQTAGWLVG
jgi:hypothetical protein